jgi:hypothetical protein
MSILFALLFCASVVCIAVLVWYIKKLISAIHYMRENLTVLVSYVNEFKGHLGVILAADNYCGEPLIQNLLVHCKDLSQFCSEYQKVFDVFEEDSAVGNEQPEDKNDEETEKER